MRETVGILALNTSASALRGQRGAVHRHARPIFFGAPRPEILPDRAIHAVAKQARLGLRAAAEKKLFRGCHPNTRFPDAL